jgi:DNA-binding Lrp family transcriptional regulator
MHATTGDADLMLKVVARGPQDLHRITGLLVAVSEVLRTSTTVSLREEMPLRLHALPEELAAE